MNDTLESENLIELHEKLNDFAKHHHNKGGQAAHVLIKQFWDESRANPTDGSERGIAINEGYDMAFSQILSLLHKTFVP